MADESPAGGAGIGGGSLTVTAVSGDRTDSSGDAAFPARIGAGGAETPYQVQVRIESGDVIAVSRLGGPHIVAQVETADSFVNIKRPREARGLGSAAG